MKIRWKPWRWGCGEGSTLSERAWWIRNNVFLSDIARIACSNLIIDEVYDGSRRGVVSVGFVSLWLWLSMIRFPVLQKTTWNHLSKTSKMHKKEPSPMKEGLFSVRLRVKKCQEIKEWTRTK